MYRLISKLMVVAIIALSFYTSMAQGFKGTGLLGVNLSQVDGDTLYGFDRAGLSIGGSLHYDIKEKYNIGLEILFSQRGSAPSFTKTNDERSIALSFIEIPVVASLHDWYVEKGDYYKVRAEAGLSYGYLFSIKAPLYVDEYFNRSDISYVLGAGLRFNKKIGIALRYTAPFGKIYQNPDKIENKMTSYFLTLRGEIYFN
jgi:hypothetical protein